MVMWVNLHVLHLGRWQGSMEGLSWLGVSWECTRVFLRLGSLWYDSRGGDGKIACVVGSARRMLKFFWMISASPAFSAFSHCFLFLFFIINQSWLDKGLWPKICHNIMKVYCSVIPASNPMWVGGGLEVGPMWVGGGLEVGPTWDAQLGPTWVPAGDAG